MKFYWLILSLIIFVLASCGESKKETKVSPPETGKQQTVPIVENNANGGELEVVFGDKILKDDYLVAQFTTRSDVFKIDNLQIYNYDADSKEYPQFLISIDFMESDLRKWASKRYPLSLCSLSLDEDSIPSKSEGVVTIELVTDEEVRGKFQGYLVNIVTAEKTQIQGHFLAKIKYNI